MKIYEVGGCVRDSLLGKTPNDFDYVVIGSSIEEMKENGFIQVGKNFPVFIKDGKEYSLARKEYKTGSSHKDFYFDFSPNTSLEDDLSRRDFTINSLARDENGKIYDYHRGLEDLRNKKIRHINRHFQDDPLRVLRGCRLAAQLDFTIDRLTIRYMKKMVSEGCLEHISPERIWKEFEKALTGKFYIFLKYLDICGALEKILPEICELKNSLENKKYHPEGNSFGHTMSAIKTADKLYPNNSLVKFCVLFHDIGKIKTPKENYPHHYGHEELGATIIRNICSRMRIPKIYLDCAINSCLNHMRFYKIDNMKFGSLYDFAKKVSGKEENLYKVCQCDAYRKTNESIKGLDIKLSMLKAMIYCQKNTHFDEIKKISKGENIEWIKKRLKDLTIEKYRRNFYA